ncbi:substrate-binding domain-containing protein [Roseinatronobacter alkalisoli]|uniref:Substrate-binding domain-containing protein n=1 Tax=Roseinatronobacter alkalisoli TaxID=3028235 RepID=A0ABT5TI14_9RHOB|nr:substrate-binding domain-containing protein [Roseinatronobacter sp. HJB301]MDD7973847.1 substrate-binding domain-containing protein [Roseinatronobacter sp. HJB301]
MSQIDILAPAAFAPVLTALGHAFDEKRTGSVRFLMGPAAGDAPESIMNRIAQPGHAQGVFLPISLMAKAEDMGKLRADTQRHVFVTSIAAAIPDGDAVPDLSTLEALDRHLSEVSRIGVSVAASGQFLRNKLFTCLPHATQIAEKVEEITGSVGEALREGALKIGFQQYSELVAEDGLHVITDIALEARNGTVICFATLVDAPDRQSVETFADFLTSPAATETLTRFGLSPAV